MHTLPQGAKGKAATRRLTAPRTGAPQQGEAGSVGKLLPTQWGYTVIPCGSSASCLKANRRLACCQLTASGPVTSAWKAWCSCCMECQQNRKRPRLASEWCIQMGMGALVSRGNSATTPASWLCCCLLPHAELPAREDVRQVCRQHSQLGVYITQPGMRPHGAPSCQTNEATKGACVTAPPATEPGLRSAVLWASWAWGAAALAACCACVRRWPSNRSYCSFGSVSVRFTAGRRWPCTCRSGGQVQRQATARRHGSLGGTGAGVPTPLQGQGRTAIGLNPSGRDIGGTAGEGCHDGRTSGIQTCMAGCAQAAHGFVRVHAWLLHPPQT
jgi:hypothetical protein